MAEPFNELSPARAEALSLIIEEAAEVIHAATKILRHGEHSFNPLDPESLSNRGQLTKEIGHLLAAVHIGQEFHLVNTDVLLQKYKRYKLQTINRYLHHCNIKIPEE